MLDSELIGSFKQDRGKQLQPRVLEMQACDPCMKSRFLVREFAQNWSYNFSAVQGSETFAQKVKLRGT
jgi:hypothetical protein